MSWHATEEEPMLISNAEEWDTCVNPASMIRHLREKVLAAPGLSSLFGDPYFGPSPRKWRLFVAACAWRVVPALGSAAEAAHRLMEFADGFTELQAPTAEARDRVRNWFNTVAWGARIRYFILGLMTADGMAAGELRNVAGHAARADAPKTEKDAAQHHALRAEILAQSGLLRCIFGNPFCPVTIKSRWQTKVAVALANGIYVEKAFDRMPILADALEKAGCDNAAVLDHCRGPGPHVRGCWVVDQVLGKA